MNRLEKMLEAKRLLKECGNYDTSIAGAIGEVYAEEVLGMTKAERGMAGVDGFINNRRVQVKAKERLRSRVSQSYVAITHDKVSLFDDLVVVIFDEEDKVYHLGPIELSKITKYTSNNTQRRYSINNIIAAIEAENKPAT